MPEKGPSTVALLGDAKAKRPCSFLSSFLSFHFVSYPMSPWTSIRVPSLCRSPTTHATCLNPPLAAKIVQKKRCLALHNTSKFGLFRSLAPCTTNESDCSMAHFQPAPDSQAGFPQPRPARSGQPSSSALVVWLSGTKYRLISVHEFHLVLRLVWRATHSYEHVNFSPNSHSEHWTRHHHNTCQESQPLLQSRAYQYQEKLYFDANAAEHLVGGITCESTC